MQNENKFNSHKISSHSSNFDKQCLFHRRFSINLRFLNIFSLGVLLPFFHLTSYSHGSIFCYSFQTLMAHVYFFYKTSSYYFLNCNAKPSSYNIICTGFSFVYILYIITILVFDGFVSILTESTS